MSASTLVPAQKPEPAPTLLPGQSERLRSIASSGKSANSDRSYIAAMKYWMAWYKIRFERDFPQSVPIEVAAVVQFILDHFAHRDGSGDETWELDPQKDAVLVASGVKGKLGPLKLSTIRHRIIVLSRYNGSRGFAANPAKSDVVLGTLNNAARSVANRLKDGDTAESVATRQMSALDRDSMWLLLSTCASDDIRDVRDRAILSVAWASGGRRRSEIATMKVSSLKRHKDGSFRWSLGRTKTNQAGRQGDSAPKVIQGSAAKALEEWLKRSGIKEGFVFRGIRRGSERPGELLIDRYERDRKRLTERPVTGNAVYLMVKERAKVAGLNDPQFLWGAHSLRAGFITEAASRGHGDTEVMKASDHRDAKTFRSYVDGEALARSPISNLLDEPAKRARSDQ